MQFRDKCLLFEVLRVKLVENYHTERGTARRATRGAMSNLWSKWDISSFYLSTAPHCLLVGPAIADLSQLLAVFYTTGIAEP